MSGQATPKPGAGPPRDAQFRRVDRTASGNIAPRPGEFGGPVTDHAAFRVETSVNEATDAILLMRALMQDIGDRLTRIEKHLGVPAEHDGQTPQPTVILQEQADGTTKATRATDYLTAGPAIKNAIEELRAAQTMPQGWSPPAPAPGEPMPKRSEGTGPPPGATIIPHTPPLPARRKPGVKKAAPLKKPARGKRK